MKTRTSILIAAAAFLLATADAVAATVTFRQGVNGYTGAVDTFLQQNPANAGTNNSTVQGLRWDGDDPSGTGYDAYTLIRFDAIVGGGAGQIPAGALITSATLTYTVFDAGDPGTLHEVAIAWAESATFNSFCAGSCDQGTEYGAQVGTAPAATIATLTTDVTASVQRWANGATNRGWIVIPTGTGGVVFRSKEYGTVAERPQLTVVYDEGPPTSNLVREPYLQLGTPTSMTVVWRTDVATDSRVAFGTTLGTYDREAVNSASGTDHIVTVTGLTPGTKYFYTVGSTSTQQGGGTSEHYFVTSPLPGTASPFRAWIFGDSGICSSMQNQVRDSMLAYTGSNPPDLFLHAGDVVQVSGADDEYTDCHLAYYTTVLRHTPFWPAMGNHDSYSTTCQDPGPCTGPYFSTFVLPTQAEAGGVASGTEGYYSFDYANVHFIVLNGTNVSKASNGPMANWLRNDLAATTQQWVVAYWHQPPYTKGTHDSDSESDLIQIRANIIPILEEAGVDLVLNGHSHGYERSYLIDGSYTNPTPTFSTLLANGNVVDDGDGQDAGDGPYLKSPGKNPHEGTVYVVTATGAMGPGGAHNHPVMHYSESANGSTLIDVDGNVLAVTFLRADGIVRDTFSIVKGDLPPQVSSTSPAKGAVVSALPSVEVTFTMDVTGVDATDVTVDGLVASSVTAVSPSVYRFTGYAPPGEGAVPVRLFAGGIAAAANPSNLFQGDSWSYTIDTTPPRVAIVTPARGSLIGALPNVVVTFTKPVTGVTAGGLAVGGSAATTVSGVPGTAGPYVFSGYAIPADGLVDVTLAATGIQDADGRPFAGDAWTYKLTRRLVINEFLASNNTAATDENGEFDDFLEIYNPTSTTVDMSGMFLTDDLDSPAQYRIPDGVTVPPKGYIVFWCDSTPSQGPTHTNFNILRAGEDIGLYDTEANGLAPIDTMTFSTQTTDVSFGRFPDGIDGFVSMRVTPGAANTIACSSEPECAALNDACNVGRCVANECVAEPANEGGVCDDGIDCRGPDTCAAGVCNGGADLCTAGEACNLGTGVCESTPLDPLPILVGESWRYFKGTTEPTPSDLTAWTAVDFDDTTWISGASGFGYGGDCATQTGTTLSDMLNGYKSLYVRKLFRIDNPARVSSLTLTVDYDDAWVAYLNGVEVARSAGAGGSPGTPLTFDAAVTTTNHECSGGSPANAADVVDLTSRIALLTAGTNVVAVHGLNVSTTSSDFVLIPSLTSAEASGCLSNAECDDGNPCTDDLCNVSVGTCSNTNDDANACTDGIACTADACVSGACNSADACTGGAVCNIETGICETGQPVTKSFQGGVDTFIDAALASQATTTPIVVDGNPVEQVLLRFDGVFGSGANQVPVGSTITSATLTLRVGSGTNDPSTNPVNYHRLLHPWVDTAVWAAYGVAPWNATAGIQADGVDAVATAEATATMTAASTAYPVSVTGSVQAWALDPSSNFGWVILPTGTDGLRLESSESTTAAYRPLLSITYLPATQGCTTNAECDDGSLCNGLETCATGVCQPGTALNCNDGNLCTDDACDPGLGCVNTNNTVACSDANACTTGDVCSGGSCTSGGPTNCDDGVACTTDGCDTVLGCSHVSNCTGGQTCNTGTGVCELAPQTVTFQDGAAGYAGTVDTFLVKGTPALDNSAATTLVVDGSPDADVRQILLRFGGLFASEGGPIPDGAEILSATLAIHITNPSADGAAFHRMVGPWQESDTWSSLVGGVQTDGAEASASADVSSLFNGTVPAFHNVDVTASVASWASGAANRGWVLVTPTGGTDSWQFDSSEAATVANRPRLTVQYRGSSGPEGRLTCSLATSTASPGGTAGLEIFLENLGGLPGVRGYETQLLVTRTSGSGTLGVSCPGGVVVDDARVDHLFYGRSDAYPTVNCALARASSSLLSGSVDVDATPDYLASYTLGVSLDATPGATFEITLAPYPDSSLADAAANPVDFETGPSCVLTVGSCSGNADCDDGNPCTDDTCDAGVCRSVVDTGNACDDGNACTTGDHCAPSGQCETGVPTVCDDGNACTVDACNTADGACVFTPAPGTACDDGNVCTTGDACDGAGACLGGAPLLCDDGDACNGAETCDAQLGCVAGTPVVCNDGDACTSDACSAGACVFQPNGTCGITGNVLYYRDGATASEPSVKPAPGVGIDITQDAGPDALTDGAGAYGFPNLFGSRTVAPTPKWGDPRAADHNDAISSFDATLIARHVVGESPLSANQQIAGDVSGNGLVTSFDAAKVVQFSVEMVNHFDVATATGSDWKFLRCDNYVSATQQDCGAPVYVHAPLGGAQVDDFHAILYGEVSGNWSPAMLRHAGATGAEEAAAVAADRAEAATLRAAPRVTVSRAPNAAPATLRVGPLPGHLVAGQRVSVPVLLEGADGIEGFDLEFRYDASALAIVDLRKGRLTTAFQLLHHDTGGALKAALWGSRPMAGSGDVLWLTIEVRDPGAAARGVEVVAVANEGRIPVRVTGSVRVGRGELVPTRTGE
jgi:hypothetical protein